MHSLARYSYRLNSLCLINCTQATTCRLCVYATDLRIEHDGSGHCTVHIFQLHQWMCLCLYFDWIWVRVPPLIIHTPSQQFNQKIRERMEAEASKGDGGVCILLGFFNWYAFWPNEIFKKERVCAFTHTWTSPHTATAAVPNKEPSVDAGVWATLCVFLLKCKEIIHMFIVPCRTVWNISRSDAHRRDGNDGTDNNRTRAIRVAA